MRWASEHFFCTLHGVCFEDLHDCLCTSCPATPRSHSLFCFVCLCAKSFLTSIELAFCLCLVLGKTVSAKRLMLSVPSWSSQSRIGRSGVGGQHWTNISVFNSTMSGGQKYRCSERVLCDRGMGGPNVVWGSGKPFLKS